jgi:adenylate kinase
MAARKIVVFLGAPGVGKGTFASLISRQKGWPTISIGEKMREEVASGTALGKRIADRMSRGELVEDNVVSELCFSVLDPLIAAAPADSDGDESTQQSCVILDGFPRSVAQSEALLDYYSLHHHHRHSTAAAATATTKSTAIKNSNRLAILAVDIRLDEHVAERKLLGRQTCQTCKQGFNNAHVVHGQYDMPAIRAHPDTCVLGKDRCNPCMTGRNDDTPTTIQRRFEVYVFCYAYCSSFLSCLSLSLSHSLSLSLSRSITACLSAFSDTTLHESNHHLIPHPSLPQSINRHNSHITYLLALPCRYNDETRPVISYFEDRDLLVAFDVKKGVRDTPDLLHLITSSLR